MWVATYYYLSVCYFFFRALKARTQDWLLELQCKSFKSEEEFDAEWREKFGEKGAKIIRETVNRNMADYHYLKQFALKVWLVD